MYPSWSLARHPSLSHWKQQWFILRRAPSLSESKAQRPQQAWSPSDVIAGCHWGPPSVCHPHSRGHLSGSKLFCGILFEAPARSSASAWLQHGRTRSHGTKKGPTGPTDPHVLGSWLPEQAASLAVYCTYLCSQVRHPKVARWEVLWCSRFLWGPDWKLEHPMLAKVLRENPTWQNYLQMRWCKTYRIRMQIGLSSCLAKQPISVLAMVLQSTLSSRCQVQIQPQAEFTTNIWWHQPHVLTRLALWSHHCLSTTPTTASIMPARRDLRAF